MSLAATIAAMAAAGCTPEQLLAVVEAHEKERLAREAAIAAIPPWKIQVAAVFKRDGYVCHYCSDKEGPFEVDHVIPRSKGGTNALSNLVVSCRSCNRSKKDMDADDFRSVGAKRQARYRARKASQSSTNRNDVTHSVTDNCGERNDHAPLKEAPHTPKENIPPISSLRSVCVARDADFDEFWNVFPKRVNKKIAKTRFFSAVKSGVDPRKIISAAKRFGEAHRIARTDQQYVKSPDAWLNAGKYDDEDLPQARAGPAARSNGRETLTQIALGNFFDDPQPSEPSSTLFPASGTDPPTRDLDLDLSQPVDPGTGGEIHDFRSSRAVWR